MRRLPAVSFLRIAILDASWHAAHMQGIGFAHALAPALGRTKDQAAALRRHAVCFGTNLFIAPALLSAVARLELEQRGAEAARLRELLAAPLSGAGDLFFWRALRPAVLACGVVALCTGSPLLAVLLGSLAFAVPGLIWRGRLFRLGFEMAAELPRQLQRVTPPRAWSPPLRLLSALAAGFLLGWCFQAGWRREGKAVFDMGLALLVGYHAHRRLVSPGVAFLLLVALGVLARWANLFSLPW